MNKNEGEKNINQIISKMKKNKFLLFIIHTLAYIAWRIEKTVGFFKRDAHVFVDYIHYKDDETGDLRKEPDSFNIYIVKWGKAEGLWSKMGWTEHKRVIEIMKNSKGHVQLDMDVGMGKSSLLIPKWAKSKIIKQLEEVEV